MYNPPIKATARQSVIWLGIAQPTESAIKKSATSVSGLSFWIFIAILNAL